MSCVKCARKCSITPNTHINIHLNLFGSFQKMVGCGFGFGAYQLGHYGSKLEVITVEERTWNKGKNRKNSLCSFLHFPMPQQHHSWYIRNGYPKNWIWLRLWKVCPSHWELYHRDGYDCFCTVLGMWQRVCSPAHSTDVRCLWGIQSVHYIHVEPFLG